MSTLSQRLRLFEAVIPLLTAAVLLLGSVILYPVKFYWPLGIGALVAVLIAYRAGFSARALSQAAWDGMKATFIALSILLLVGALIGVWMAAGTVPTLVYYGLLFASPRFLVPVAFLLAVAVSMMLGTSVGTLSTLGVAIMGVAQGVGLPLPLVAGALVSGALVGDRTSPLSGSLNLNVAMTGTSLRNMMSRLWQTGAPAVAITLLLYGLVGVGTTPSDTGADGALLQSLASSVVISPWMLLPPLLVLGLSFFRVKVKWALGVGVVAGILLAVLVGGQEIRQPVLAALYGHVADTADPSLNRILSGGGLFPMVHQIILILVAGAFSGVMEATGMMAMVLEGLVRGVTKPLTMVLATMGISTAVAGIASNQALAIIIPGRMLRGSYERLGLSPELLSRTLADSGTLTAVLIPWNVMSMLSAAALGVPSVQFIPYTWLAMVLPAISIWTAYREERRSAPAVVGSGSSVLGLEKGD